MNVIFYFAVSVTIFSAAALLFTFGMMADARVLNARLLQVARSAAAMEREREREEKAESRIVEIFRALRGRIGLSENRRLRERFIAAGKNDARSIEMYFAARMLLPVFGILIGSFIQSNTFFWILVQVVVGYMAPDFVLDRKIVKRRERLRKSIPDAVDLLVICVDAGLGMDQAMLRAGQELTVSHPEINEEFLQINREQRAGKPRIEAWRSMAERTKLPDIESFVNMLVQTERFGTPIARALSQFADGLRQKRRQLAEERAAKTTVKIIFPLVLFIFPCMFIVLLGPAIISIIKNVSSLTK